MRIPSPVMTECFRPTVGYLNGFKESGKPNYSFRSIPKGSKDAELYYCHADLVVPCGHCASCIYVYRREWMCRAGHEARYYSKNCFVTLTYADEHLPEHGSLSRQDHRWFLKRLRRAVGDVRYLGCGEYGDKLERPHLHYALFGVDFPDREFAKMSKSGFPMDRSAILSGVWNKGDCYVQGYDDSVAGYVAGYLFKKTPTYLQNNVNPVTGLRPYERLLSDGRVVSVLPEFLVASKRPALGRRWFDEFNSDLDKGYLTWRGMKFAPPRIYLQWLEKEFPDRYEALLEKRREFVTEALTGDSSWDRLATREAVAESFHKGLRARV